MNKYINIERILEYYDVPQLFIGRDKIGTRYLCLLFDDSETYHYISIAISLEKLSLFISGKLDLRELYIYPEFENEYYKVSYNNNTFILEQFPAEALSEDMLPEQGYFYSDEQEDVSIIQEAIEHNHPVIHLGFVDAINSHSIPVNTLAVLTTQYQAMVSNCFKKIDGTKNDNDFKLNVFSYSAASFNVHMYAESNLDLFGSSRIDKTLKTLDNLLKSSTEEELRKAIEPLKGHTISSYKNFIKELIQNKISVKYKWVSSIAEAQVLKNKVSIPVLEKMYEILIESSELEREIKVYEGYMVGSYLDSGKWTLKTIDGDEVKGITKMPELLSGVVLAETKYKITCEEIIEQNNISSKEKSILYLLEIE